MSHDMNRGMQSQFELRPLGYIHGDFSDKFGTPRQGRLAPHGEGEITLLPEWRGKGFLSGLADFSHVWLLSYFHRNDNQTVSGKIHPPRLEGEKVGVLASRSPHRPNALGLTLAEVVRVESDRLVVRGIDLISGTPILDIKPYIRDCDAPEHYRGGWTETLPERNYPVRWSNDASAQLRDDRVRQLIEEMLKLDPRPQAYRDRVSETFALWVAGLNVVFTYNEGVFEVTQLSDAPVDLEKLRQQSKSKGPLPHSLTRE